MGPTTCLVLGVSTVLSATKIHLELQALVASTKQSRQAGRAGRLAGQAGWQGRQADNSVGSDCLVFCLLLALILLSEFFNN